MSISTETVIELISSAKKRYYNIKMFYRKQNHVDINMMLVSGNQHFVEVNTGLSKPVNAVNISKRGTFHHTPSGGKSGKHQLLVSYE